jgi:hypothetical protein
MLIDFQHELNLINRHRIMSLAVYVNCTFDMTISMVVSSLLVMALLHFFPTEFRAIMARIAPPHPDQALHSTPPDLTIKH